MGHLGFIRDRTLAPDRKTALTTSSKQVRPTESGSEWTPAQGHT